MCLTECTFKRIKQWCANLNGRTVELCEFKGLFVGLSRVDRAIREFKIGNIDCRLKQFPISHRQRACRVYCGLSSAQETGEVLDQKGA